MNRRDFLRIAIGAGAIAAVPPSMIWPFKKIFIPLAPKLIVPSSNDLVMPSFDDIEALELEKWANLPDVICNSNTLYQRFKELKRRPIFPGQTVSFAT